MVWGFTDGTGGKEPACQCGKCKRHRLNSWLEKILEDIVETHFSILAWRIPVKEEPEGIQSIESQSDMSEVT